MERVDIRYLKAHLTRYLNRVESGAKLDVSKRGRVIAIISPAERPADVDWPWRLVSQGRALWSGGKPLGS